MSEDEWGRVEFENLRIGDTIRAEHMPTGTTLRGVAESSRGSRIDIAGLGLNLRDEAWRFWRLRPSSLPEPIEPGTVVEAADHAHYAVLSSSLLSPDRGGLEWWPISETHPKIVGGYCAWSDIEQPAKIIGRLRFEPIGADERTG